MQNPSPTRRALLIGINGYPNLPPTSKLSGCINDVDLMRDLLLRRFGFTAGNITSLCNEQATQDGILKSFEDLVADVERNDIVVVYFAGHGSSVQTKTKGSGWAETIVPYDSGRRSTGHPSKDITDVQVDRFLLKPLVHKTPFVTLFFDSCHSGSILRDDFCTAARGIDPDGEIRKDCGVDNGETRLLHTLNHRTGDSFRGYVLLAACRADESAREMTMEGKSYGAFTYLLCKLINESRDEDMRTLFRLASADLTARYPSQHPILEGAQNALIFGTNNLETPRYLPIRRIETVGTTTLVEMDGGLACGVTHGSIWAIRPIGSSPQNSDTRIKVKDASAFVSQAEVIHQGRIEGTFGCFEVLHVYGSAVLNILVDSQRDPRLEEMLSQSGSPDVSGSLKIVKNADKADVKVVLLQPRGAVATGDLVPQLGPLNHETWVTSARDGRIILPPTSNLSDLCENLRKLARYQFGLRLRNIDEENPLRGKLGLQLRWRRKGSNLNDPWLDAPMGMEGFPYFQNGDHIACVVTNQSEVAVWPYVLEFAEDGSVRQQYPYPGGEERLASGRSTKEIARMSLGVSNENAFQLAAVELLVPDGTSWTEQRNDRRPQRRVTEVLKLFASTERIDLSLLLQTSLAPVRGLRGLSDLLLPGMPLGRGNICAWWTVEEPFVLDDTGEER